MSARHLLVVAVLLVAAVAPGTLAAAAQDEASTCETTVTHDWLMDDQQAIDRLANGSAVSNDKSNTRVTIDEANSFYRVTGENPNGYCIRIVIRADEAAIPPAELPGTVEANDADLEATWDATHDFETDTTSTRIAFTLPPETTATFSPSQARIVSLAWTSKTAEESKSRWENITERYLPQPDVTQKTYTIEPDGSARVVVPLEQQNGSARVDEWKALYRVPNVEGHDSWRAVDQDAAKPVYYESIRDGSAVAFYFDETSRGNATVRFYANPGTSESLDYEVKSWTSGLSILGDLFSLQVRPRTVIP